MLADDRHDLSDPGSCTLIRRLRLTVRIVAGALLLLLIGYALPERLQIPVENATSADWNADSFWYEPWGASGVHKGIDIFAPVGRNAIAAVDGIVLYQGRIRIGGNIVIILGPKWRVHYYAHLETIRLRAGTLVTRGEVVGTVGNSGNAAGKPSHLHYVILTPVPYPWRARAGTQGWKRMFYLDPDSKLRAAGHN